MYSSAKLSFGDFFVFDCTSAGTNNHDDEAAAVWTCEGCLRLRTPENQQRSTAAL